MWDGREWWDVVKNVFFLEKWEEGWGGRYRGGGRGVGMWEGWFFFGWVLLFLLLGSFLLVIGLYV